MELNYVFGKVKYSRLDCTFITYYVVIDDGKPIHKKRPIYSVKSIVSTEGNGKLDEIHILYGESANYTHSTTDSVDTIIISKNEFIVGVTKLSERFNIIIDVPNIITIFPKQNDRIIL